MAPGAARADPLPTPARGRIPSAPARASALLGAAAALATRFDLQLGALERGVDGAACGAADVAPVALAPGPTTEAAALGGRSAHFFAFFLAAAGFGGAGFGATWSTIFGASIPKALNSATI